MEGIKGCEGCEGCGLSNVGCTGLAGELYAHRTMDRQSFSQLALVQLSVRNDLSVCIPHLSIGQEDVGAMELHATETIQVPTVLGDCLPLSDGRT